MGYLYKLVDKNGLEDSKKGIISLSHPIFEFKGSEGKFINFAKRIYTKYQKKGLKITPSKKDLEDIRGWIEIFKKTYGESFRDVDIISESMIIFCGIMQGFCGYFTTEDLSDEVTRKEYLLKSKFSSKIAIIKIDEAVFDHLEWSSLNVEGEFTKFNGNPNKEKFIGYMHPTTIIYSEKYDDYNELLSIYNGGELRHAHTWFNNLSSKFEWQKEKRLLFLLRSLDPCSLRIGCESVYKCGHRSKSWEEAVYEKIVDAIHYCSNGPRFISLKIDDDNVEIITLT